MSKQHLLIFFALLFLFPILPILKGARRKQIIPRPNEIETPQETPEEDNTEIEEPPAPEEELFEETPPEPTETKAEIPEEEALEEEDVEEETPEPETELFEETPPEPFESEAEISEEETLEEEIPEEPITEEEFVEKDAPYTLPGGRLAEATGNTSEAELSLQDKKTKKDKLSQKEIYLNFENSSLANFINYIAEIKNLNLIPDPKVADTKISLTIRKPLSIEGAWNVFLTVIEMAGYSIIKIGNLHKIIPNTQKKTEPLPAYINVPASTLPDSDETIRFVTFLTNISLDKVKGLLTSMLSPNSPVISHENSNGFIITDKCYNIKAAMNIIQELDKTNIEQTVSIIKLKEADAKDVKGLLDGLKAERDTNANVFARLLGRQQEDKTLEFFPSTIKIIAEERTNSLILLGDQKSIDKIENFIKTHIDTKLQGIKSPIHIYELKNTDAEQIKDILEKVATPSDVQALQQGGIRGGVKYFKPMKFGTDKSGNRIIVTSTDDQDWKLIKKTIKELDKPQPQVAIETLIVTVDFSKSKFLGSQIRNKKHGQIGKHIDFQAANLGSIISKSEGDNSSLLGNLFSSLTAGLGSTILTFGKSGDIWNVIKMLQSQTNTSVLSQPFIVTTNNKTATAIVGKTQRVVTEQAIGENTGSGGDAYSYDSEEASLTLKVTPQINLNGVIKLGIDVDLKEFVEGGGDKPDTTDKHLDTEVSVANGQILVLGGFVKTKVLESTYKTPVLNKIPVLGWLFKSKDRAITKEYIFIFMSPTIVKPRKIPGTNLYTKMKLHQATTDIDNTIEVKHTQDPIHNWFFNPEKETYSHKVVDYANARYQPTTVDIAEDPYYRAKTLREEKKEEIQEETDVVSEEKTKLETPESEAEISEEPMIEDEFIEEEFEEENDEWSSPEEITEAEQIIAKTETTAETGEEEWGEKIITEKTDATEDEDFIEDEDETETLDEESEEDKKDETKESIATEEEDKSEKLSEEKEKLVEQRSKYKKIPREERRKKLKQMLTVKPIIPMQQKTPLQVKRKKLKRVISPQKAPISQKERQKQFKQFLSQKTKSPQPSAQRTHLKKFLASTQDETIKPIKNRKRSLRKFLLSETPQNVATNNNQQLTRRSKRRSFKKFLSPSKGATQNITMNSQEGIAP